MKFKNWYNHFHWRRWRLTNKLLLFYLPLIIIPLLLGMYLVTSLYDNMSREQTKEGTEQTLSFIVEKIEDRFKSMENDTLSFFVDDVIIQAMEKTSYSQLERIETERILRQRKSEYLSNSLYQPSLIISSPYQTFILGDQTLELVGTEGFVNEIKKQNGRPVWKLATDEFTNETMFLMGRVINETAHFKTKGYIIMVVDPRAIRDVLRKAEISQSVQYSMVSENGEQWLSYQQGENIEENEPTMKIPIKSKKYGWTLTATIPLIHLYETVEKARNLTFWVIVIFVAVGIIITRLFSIDFVIPIKEMMHNIKQALLGLQPGKLKRIRGAREIVVLNDTFISVMYEIHNLNKEMMLTQKKKQEADIQVLQQQLSPHFLYNALNSIRWMAMIHKQNNIKEMVDSLTSLLHYSIRDIGVPVLLENEIKILQDYVNIQKVRYQDFILQIDMEGDLKEAIIHKFLLQPIIENSIIHGLSNSGRTGIITIKAYINNDLLVIELSDNGSGISEKRLKKIKDSLLNESKSNHLGLKSVNDRIHLHHGKRYGLIINSEEDEGTNVTIHLPLSYDKREETG